MTYQGMETKIGPAAIDQEQVSVDYSVIDGAIGKVFPGEIEHPGIADGSLKSDMINKLEELSPEKNKDIDEIDPRWDDLKKLLIDKNK